MTEVLAFLFLEHSSLYSYMTFSSSFSYIYIYISMCVCVSDLWRIESYLKYINIFVFFFFFLLKKYILEKKRKINGVDNGDRMCHQIY
jgi:hypothetical protein